MNMQFWMVAVGLWGCGSQSENKSGSPVQESHTDGGLYHVYVENDPHPPVTGATHLALDISTPDESLGVEGASLTITPWMPDHGHGISEAPVITEQGEGSYGASFAFSMPGDWDVSIVIDGESGTDEVVFGYEVE